MAAGHARTGRIIERRADAGILTGRRLGSRRNEPVDGGVRRPSGEPVFAWDVPGVAVGFSGDGRTLAARARERTVLLSIPSVDDLLKRARRLVTEPASAEERGRFGL